MCNALAASRHGLTARYRELFWALSLSLCIPLTDPGPDGVGRTDPGAGTPDPGVGTHSSLIRAASCKLALCTLEGLLEPTHLPLPFRCHLIRLLPFPIRQVLADPSHFCDCICRVMGGCVRCI